MSSSERRKTMPLVALVVLAAAILAGCPPAADVLPGETYETAEVKTGGTYPDQTTVGYANDYEFAGQLEGTVPGLDRVYRVSVPNNWSLRATVTAANGVYDPAVVLVAISDLSVADDADVTTAGGAEIVSSPYNYSGVDTDYYIVVDSTDAGGAGPFTLLVELID